MRNEPGSVVGRTRARYVALSALCLVACVQAADQPLVVFGPEFDAAAVSVTDAKVTVSGTALRIATGHGNDWPGVRLKAPGDKWDLSAFSELSLNVKNVGANEVTVSCRVDNVGADGAKNCITGNLTLAPGASETLTIKLPHKLPPEIEEKLFGMRGYPLGANTKRSLDPSKVTQLLVFVGKPKADHVFEISAIRASGHYAGLPADKPFFPFIDTFGQYIHADWPGKVHSLEELSQRRDEEAKELAAKPGPADWDKYGGWAAGPTLKATGFFRVEKYKGKWWLVDPDGKLFFSHGIDSVRSLGSTPVADRETWFQDYPGDKPEFKEFVGKQYALHGHYAGQTPKTFSFVSANLKRKYGSEWRALSAEMAHTRLRSWGLNTLGNWTDAAVQKIRKTPYVATIHFGGKLLEGSDGYWGKFRDVFDPSFKEALAASMQKEKGRAAGDPWCLGFFVDNEIAWGDETSLAVAALKSPPEQVAKKVFVDDLKAKYGAIEKLNAAWGAQHASWDALLQYREAPDKKKAVDDLTAFYTRTAETYFKTVHEAVKEAAPGQLYLGCRFAWVNPRATTAAAKYCDVVSFNLYHKSVADFKFSGNADVPLIIGEFHFGALDRGMFHTGLVALRSQAERAQTYKSYVEGCLRHPNFVGCHWFEFQDEAATGRPLDEENYQIGFIDGADTPYRETIDAARDVGYIMYKLRLGE